MNANIQAALLIICQKLINTIEYKFQQEPIGCCYLIGHCLAEGLSKAGFLAEKHSGHLILKDKNNKNIVYGAAKYKGRLIGYYHTWCVLKDGRDTIIIDPSLKYNKIALRRYYKIKLDINIPDILITNETKGISYNYIRDEKLNGQSEDYLSKLNIGDMWELIEFVSATTIILTDLTLGH